MKKGFCRSKSLLKILFGQFLASAGNTFKRLRYQQHTKDKDFTDKPFRRLIVSDKQAFCQALDYVAYAVLRYHIGFFDAFNLTAVAIQLENTGILGIPEPF